MVAQGGVYEKYGRSSDVMLALVDLKQELLQYRAGLIEMGDSL